MRTEKELWELVLSRTDLFGTGLCFWVEQMYRSRSIKHEEEQFLSRVLGSELPQREEHSLYCWPPFKIEPRIEWIKNRIKQLDDENKS